MIRVILFLVAIGVLAYGFAWLANFTTVRRNR